MSMPVLIMGPSGTGKSTSMRNMSKDKIALINVQGKPLPFKGKLDSFQTKSFDTITKMAVGAQRESVIVDDFGYAITDYYTRHSLGKERDRDQFEVYKSIAALTYNFIDAVQKCTDEDRIVYIIMHTDQDNNGNIVPMTVGKLLNEKISIVGMMTVCILSTITDDGEHRFIVNGQPPAKSPLDMFDAESIPNDLATVDTAIRDFYGMKPLSEC